MACDCIKKSEKQILEKLRENNPERKYSSGIYTNGGYIFDLKQTILNNVFEAEYTIEGKSGKSKVEKLNILMDYCPMCGKKYKEEKEGENG
jgi:hypothetical protein